MTSEFYTSLTNESLLVDQAKADPQAFAAIYDFYFARVYNYTRYRVLDPIMADDLTSTIFEKVLANLHSYQAKRGPFSAWLFSIARNTVNYSLRRQKIRQWVSLEQLRYRVSPDPEPDEIAATRETNRQLLTAIHGLKERERALVALKFSSGLTNRTISEMTGLKESHVGVILHRAIKQMRAQFDEHEVSR